MFPGERYLKFRCTQCGNCCKDPLLPLTDNDVRRIVKHTGEAPAAMISWVDRNGIDLDDEPEAFAILRQGKRVMVLKHERGGCRYLGADDRCTIYGARPLGCRIFPFDPTYSKRNKLRRLKLINATECKYELDGNNDPERLRVLHERYEAATEAFREKIAAFNREQRRRKRAGKRAQTARDFLAFLDL